MKKTYQPKNKDELVKIIQNEIKIHGDNCDLNHIDTSLITDMSYLFSDKTVMNNWNLIHFNGDISKWNTSNVKSMRCMFQKSNFNGNISSWDTSSVIDMFSMFSGSQFNQDISNWNISNVTNISFMFAQSKYSYDLSLLKPYSATEFNSLNRNTSLKNPFWLNISDLNERKKAIDSFHLSLKINNKISNVIKNNINKI